MASSSAADTVSLPGWLCSTPALTQINTNSSFSEIVSPCLADVVFPSIPALAALISLTWLFLRSQFQDRCVSAGLTISLGGLAASKILFSTLDLTLSLLDLLFCFLFSTVYLGPGAVLPEAHNSALLDLSFSIFALAAYLQCLRAKFNTSASLHLAWFLRLLSLLPAIVRAIENASLVEVPEDIPLLFRALLSFVLVLLFCFADSLKPVTVANGNNYRRLHNNTNTGDTDCDGIHGQHGRRPQAAIVSPECSSSAIAQLIYAYAGGMVWKGLKGDVSFEDLWELETWNQADTLRARFYATAKGRQPTRDQPLTISHFYWRLFLCVWEFVAAASALNVFIVLGRFANASFLRMIVVSVTAHHPLWLSIVAMVALCAVDLAGKLMTARRDVHSFRSFMNMRSVLNTAIFDKMLKLSAAAKSRYSAGEVLNLLTTDVLRIRNLFFDLREFIYCPSLVIVAFAGLYLEIGWNAALGLLILLAVFPINYILSKLSTHYEQIQLDHKDKRLKLTNDVLSGIKVLKLYAWEESMQRKLFEIRHHEVKTLQKLYYLFGAITASFQLAPLIATLVSFYGFTVVQGNPLRPDVAFVSLLFFSMLRYAIYQFPQLISYCVQAWVSGRRVLAFLNEDEQQTGHIMHDATNGPEEPVVQLDRCSFTWNGAPPGTAAGNGNNPPIQHLSNITLSVPRGQLLGIVGRVGSGKSSLLSAILGEMERLTGPIQMSAETGDTNRSEHIIRARSIGYVPQQPWIQNRTLRSNVLFDAPMEERRYRSVLEGCALEDDLKLLVAGDLTEIGEKGINLSGGQKARVALARAVYLDAELYVLDDTLSAVDAHVGAHIFERVIGPRGLLAGKTRLWALNSLSFLRHCDRVVVMDGGKINAIGTLSELMQKQEGPFADLMREFVERHVERRESTKSEGIEVEVESQELAEVLSQLSGSPLSHSLLEHRRLLEERRRREPELPSISRSLPANGNSSGNRTGQEPRQTLPLLRQRKGTTTISGRLISALPSSAGQMSSLTDLVPQNSSSLPTTHLAASESDDHLAMLGLGRLTDEEELVTGMVARRVYLDYARAFGFWLSLAFIACLFLGSSTSEAMANVWLAKWSSSAAEFNGSSTANAKHNLAIYGGFSTFNVFCTALSCLIVAVGAYHASTAFHNQLVRSLFHSPMAFFDRTPLGRILNRLSNDIYRIDENIPWAICLALQIFAEAINSLIAICIVIPLLLIVVLPLLVIFLAIVHFYNVASVQFRRLTSKSVSSFCSFIQDAHLGSDSIRVFNVTGRFQYKCNFLSDFNNKSQAMEIYANRWLQVRLDLVSDIAVLLCVLVAILMASKGVISLGALALVIGCGYTFTGYLGEIARIWRESEVQMVCVERVNEYINNEHEAEWRRQPPQGLLAQWPRSGAIEFRDICLRYRADMDLVLRNLNFEVRSTEKVGIVGRTGAGKSSLTLALFRIVEPSAGQIIIDGVDIGTIGLHDLREALTIIPQDPVLFCGSLRFNLDPFEEHSDFQIWEALEKAYLKETVTGLDSQLDYEIADAGSNLSVGQRQLVCMARAILRHKTRILVLDEATAAVDADTDARIQETIRTQFKHCTVLTIAHRLNTILDYDRVLVMDAGQMAEFDTPQALLANSHSLFAQLARQAGIAGAGGLDVVKGRKE